MYIEYRLIPRRNPNDSKEDSKYYAIVVRNKNQSYRDLVNDIADLSTVNHPDVMAVLESLFQLIPKLLKEGKSVPLGDLGDFYLNIRSEGAETEEDFHHSLIKGIMIRFRPSTLLKEEMDKAKYKIKENGNTK
jgi:predicted histone-like DNA-binding protein